MKLVVGLGNPGGEYEYTRHNVGFMALDKVARNHNVSISTYKFDGMYGDGIINGEKYIFLKPFKYMNLSGQVIKKYMDFYKIDISNLLVIHDDIDMPVGKYRIKIKGTSGGHNGLKNIEECLGSNVYNRIKIGVSKDKNYDTKDYVLGKFSKDDLEIINKVIDRVGNIFEDYTENSIINVMSKYNNKDI